MKNRLPTRDPIGKELRRSRAQQRIGYGARCSCGESRPEALIENSNPMICAECKRKQNGLSSFDRHHVAGKANHDLTVPIPVNDHRTILTEAMYDWPKATRENPTGSPLLALAACIRGFCDTTIFLMEQLLLRGAETLESLHFILIEKSGDKYWIKRESRENELER